jgi:hypothetical protein
MSFDLDANLFDGAANATQNAIDISSDLDANSLLILLIQLKMQ